MAGDAIVLGAMIERARIWWTKSVRTGVLVVWPAMRRAKWRETGVDRARASIGGAAIGFVVSVLACWMVGGGVSALAAEQGKGEFVSKVKHAVLMDAATGGVLFQHNADDLAQPASMSKLMTLAVTFKLLKAGRLKLTDEFVMSVHAWRTGGAPSRTAAMMVPVNKKETLSDLLQGIAVQSGNDAAISIAEGIAGTEEKFAKLMTEEARRIGMSKSQFRNPTGLENPEHLMTVRELAILARHIIRTYPEFMYLFAQKEFRYRRHKFINRNPLLFSDNTVDGMKTGHLKVSGYGLVLTAKRGERRMIVVVHGAENAKVRRSEAARLLEWGFKNVAAFKLFDPGETVGHARVWGGSVFYLPLVGRGAVDVWLPRYPANQRLRGEIVYSGPLKAPIKRGDRVARLRVTSSSSAVQEVPLYASRDVSEGGLMWRGLDSLAHLAFRLVPH